MTRTVNAIDLLILAALPWAASACVAPSGEYGSEDEIEATESVDVEATQAALSSSCVGERDVTIFNAAAGIAGQATTRDAAYASEGCGRQIVRVDNTRARNITLFARYGEALPTNQAACEAISVTARSIRWVERDRLVPIESGDITSRGRWLTVPVGGARGFCFLQEIQFDFPSADSGTLRIASRAVNQVPFGQFSRAIAVRVTAGFRLNEY